MSKKIARAAAPKFVVRDDEGGKWKVKLGLEARPETVCTRLLWAVGYYANEDYFVRDLKVAGMPPRLHRGQEFVDADGSVHNVRLKREASRGKKIGIWQWRHDAFTGTRELNGLRVLMAVINNWDLKDVNNAIYQVGPERDLHGQRPGSEFRIGGTHLAFRERQRTTWNLIVSLNSSAGLPPIPWISPFPRGLRGSFGWIRRK